MFRRHSTICSQRGAAASQTARPRPRSGLSGLGLPMLLAGILAAPVGVAQEIGGAGEARCQSPRVPQAWTIEEPRSAAEGETPLLVRRQSEHGGGRGTELPIPLPLKAGEEPLIVYGDPSSPYLYIAVTPASSATARVRLLVLCKSATAPRVIADESMPIDFPLIIDPEVVAEEPGEAVALLVGEDRTLLWRNATGRAELVRWPRPVRSINLLIGKDLRLSALLDDGSLWERRVAVTDPMPGAAARAGGWRESDGRALLRGGGRVWLRDTEDAMFALAAGAGLRLDRRRGEVQQLYGKPGEHLAAWDRFYSLDGQRTALFLLLAEEVAGQWRYRGRIHDLAQDGGGPVMEFEVTDLFEKGRLAQPIVLLQAWDDSFTHVTGFIFHNPGGHGVVETADILPLWDRQTRRVGPRLVVSAQKRQPFRREILPFQVSVFQDKRRERVFFFADQEGYMERFDDPIEQILSAPGAGSATAN